MQFSPEQEDFRAWVAAFVAEHCPPEQANEWDLSATYPAELYARMAKLGWVGIPFPERYGGAGGSVVDMCILAEELSRSSYDIATGIGLTMFCGLTVLRYGSEEQIERYVRPAIAGESRFAICITEPESGSDASSIRLRAEPTADGCWRLSGQKVFNTGVTIPNTVMLVAARTSPDRHGGISLFLVPNSTPGITARRLPTLGRRIIGTSEVYYDDVRVGPGQLLGEVGAGWEILKSGLLAERLVVSACYAGSGQAVVDEVIRYSAEREQFGRPIGEFQAISHMIADMQTSVDAARLLVYDAAEGLATQQDSVRKVAQAKLFGSEMLVKLTTDAMQILGGYGYVTDSTVQRHFRDARAATITAGTSQIQRTIIARRLGVGGATRGN